MKSATNYNPILWGKCGWEFLHYVSLGYSNKPTDEDKTHYKNFMLELGHVLPCVECRENFKKHNIKYPIDEYLKNSNSLFNWIIKIQNEINYQNHMNKSKKKKQIDSKLMKKYYVNENRRLEMKNCCGLEATRERLLKKIESKY